MDRHQIVWPMYRRVRRGHEHVDDAYDANDWNGSTIVRRMEAATMMSSAPYAIDSQSFSDSTFAVKWCCMDRS